MIPKIYLDTNVFIEAFEKVGPVESSVWPIFEALEQKKFSAATSEITLAELLPMPIANGHSNLAMLYQRLFREQDVFEAAPVTQGVLVRSAHLRAIRSSLRLPDAIHLATASMWGCAVILSNDRRLSSASDLPVVPFASDTLSRIRSLGR